MWIVYRPKPTLGSNVVGSRRIGDTVCGLESTTKGGKNQSKRVTAYLLKFINNDRIRTYPQSVPIYVTWTSKRVPFDFIIIENTVNHDNDLKRNVTRESIVQLFSEDEVRSVNEVFPYNLWTIRLP